MDTFKEGTDYYMENGKLVLTSVYLTKIRKSCCGNSCKNCPYFPTWEKGNKVLKNESKTEED
jgi:hypothetical protein